jgi:hydrogenase nickel incorporation protein HypB
MSQKVKLEERVGAANAEIAQALRQQFRARGIFVANFIGSPGSGKTSLLEALAPRLRGRTAVIEGDLQTDEDKRRIERTGLPAYQINTGGACHLDARMIREALAQFPLGAARLLVIENVGNLVCPASFELGEDVKVTVVSVAEGDDKPAKYPVALKRSAALVITKIDLLPYITCDPERMQRDALAANPALKVFMTSARMGAGLEEFHTWLTAGRT